MHVGCGNKPKMLKSFKLKNLKEKFENTMKKVNDGLVMDATKINQLLLLLICCTLSAELYFLTIVATKLVLNISNS